MRRLNWKVRMEIRYKPYDVEERRLIWENLIVYIKQNSKNIGGD
jgi:hypothetical protein